MENPIEDAFDRQFRVDPLCNRLMYDFAAHAEIQALVGPQRRLFELERVASKELKGTLQK